MSKDTETGIATADRASFIAAMGSVAASVGVVTTDGKSGRHGATVTAFASVSADPPTVLVCLHAQSRIAHMTQDNGQFCLNILAKSDQAVADRFAGKDDGTLSDRFDGIDTAEQNGASPIIANATAFSCKVDASHLAGSHMIFIGLVTDIASAGQEPLTYRDRAYHQVIPVQTDP